MHTAHAYVDRAEPMISGFGIAKPRFLVTTFGRSKWLRAARQLIASGKKAADARKTADVLACDAWNKRMLGYRGPAQRLLRWSSVASYGLAYVELHPMSRPTPMQGTWS
jgi:hypothetical protein